MSRGVALVPRMRKERGIHDDLSILDNMSMAFLNTKWKKLLISGKAERERFARQQKALQIKAGNPADPITSLSGGNQQKVILARELESQPSLLVMAHPTRGLDIGAASFVHEQMIAARERGVGILLISADFDEILEMSDRILVCFEGQIMGEFSGKNPPIEEISLAMTGK